MAAFGIIQKLFMGRGNTIGLRSSIDISAVFSYSPSTTIPTSTLSADIRAADGFKHCLLLTGN